MDEFAHLYKINMENLNQKLEAQFKTGVLNPG